MHLEIPEGPFEAYIFDCDGTITDSMPLHYIAWQDVLSRFGCPFSESQFYETAGRPTAQIVRMLNEQHGLTMPVAEVVHRRDVRFHEMLPEVKGVAEVVALIRASRGVIPMAVASGSRRDSVLKSLHSLGLEDRFDAIVAAEDYDHGKPAPDVFLLAAQRLGVDPAKCLVFEDAELGVQAAQAAGMKWVKVDPRRSSA